MTAGRSVGKRLCWPVIVGTWLMLLLYQSVVFFLTAGWLNCIRARLSDRRLI